MKKKTSKQTDITVHIHNPKIRIKHLRSEGGVSPQPALKCYWLQLLSVFEGRKAVTRFKESVRESELKRFSKDSFKPPRIVHENHSNPATFTTLIFKKDAIKFAAKSTIYKIRKTQHVIH